MKKRLILLMSLIFAVGLVSCSNNKGGDVVPTKTPDVIDENLDDNGTNNVDKDVRIDPKNDPNHIDGLDYTYNGDWGHNGEYKKPGLYNTDGTVHTMPKENENGKKINVMVYGAQANNPEFDNTQPVKDAIKAAKEGDYIYFPAGKWYFSSKSLSNPFYSHIYAYKDGVNFVGAGAESSILVSKFSNEENLNKKTATLTMVNVKNVTVKNLGFTAEVPSDKLPELDTGKNNKDGNALAPNSQIVAINVDPDLVTSNVVVRDCHISHFQTAGIYFYQTIDCQAFNNVVEKATDIGGLGHGYGIWVRGGGWEAFGMVGTNMDSRYNVIYNNVVKGPWIRHAIILSYVTHNNLVYGNTIDQCQDEPLDLHGEDEFLNVITKNNINNVTRAAIGLGNPGATHDATGPGNVIYGNKVAGANGGIVVSYGTPDTQVYNNEIKCTGIGINVTFGPNTVIRNNNIEVKAGADALPVGVQILYSYVWDKPENGVYLVDIQSNNINSTGTGMKLEVYRNGTKIKNNKLTNCTTEIENTKNEFVVPERSTYFDEVKGEMVYATKEGNINRGSYNQVVNNHGYYWFKGSHEEPGYNRMIFEEFDIDRTLLDKSNKVYLRLTTTSKSAKQNYFIWGCENLEWDNTKMTWGNAPFVNNPVNNPELKEDPTGQYSTDEYPYECKLYDPEKKCKLIVNFQCVVINDEFLTYYIDVTDYFKNTLKGSNVTMIFTNETMDGAYSSVRNANGNPQNVWPCLIFA